MTTLEGVEKDVVAWHRETFPNATIKSIEEKFDEEEIEFILETMDNNGCFCDKAASEFADMCIVYMAGLAKIGKQSLTSLIVARLSLMKQNK